MYRKISLIGAAIDACGNKRGAAGTPDTIKPKLANFGLNFEEVYYYNDDGHNIDMLSKYFTKIANSTKDALLQNRLPIVIGGDHSCAIGTWSGVADVLQQRNEELGLIWIDAHMDAHTPETSQSGNIHGMPVATIMGYGHKQFLNILTNNPKIKPDNIVLIGIRSFELEEAKLLSNLGVKIYYNHDISQHGLKDIFVNEWSRLNNQVDRIGFSIDLDGFDPKYAPGVSTPVADGIDFIEFLSCLDDIDINKIIAVEITEGNSKIDSNITMECIIDIIAKVKILQLS